MAHLNWSKFDGAEFESLIQTMLLIEDSSMVVFGRPGIDHGMDAVSGDGTHVYQAKHSNEMSMTKAVSLAVQELSKIDEHKTESDPYYQYWKNVTKWTLCANVAKNPGDSARWNEKVKPLFSAKGIDADYLGAEEVESRLEQMPEVRDSYFGDVNRTFLSLGEVHAMMSRWRTGRFIDIDFTGRVSELRFITSFATDEAKRFLVVKGTAGIGKSRLLYESAVLLSNAGWRILWGRQETLLASTTWTRSVNTARRTCIIVDSITDVRLVERLYDQLQVSEKMTWKVVVSCQPDFWDSILARIKGDCVIQELMLTELTELEASGLLKKIAKELGHENTIEDLSGIARLAKCRPGWMCLLSSYLFYCRDEGRIGISDSAMDAIAAHISGRIANIDSARRAPCINILRWLAAWRIVALPNNEEIAPQIKFIATRCGVTPSSVIDMMEELGRNDLLCRWGEQTKYYTVEPEIVRQKVLADWLLEKLNHSFRVSLSGREIIKCLLNEDVPLRETVFVNLASLSVTYLKTGEQESFMAPVFKVLDDFAKSQQLSTQMTIVDWIDKIGFVSPECSLDVINTIYSTPCETQKISNGIWGEVELSQKMVIERLPWSVYCLAPYAESAGCAVKCWQILIKLFADEVVGKIKPRDGSCTVDLLRRLLTDVDDSSTYGDFAIKCVNDELSAGRLSPLGIECAKAILAVERQSATARSSRILAISRSAIIPGSKGWERLTSLHENLYAAFSGAGEIEQRIRLWDLLAAGFASLSGFLFRVRLPTDVLMGFYRQVMVKDFNCAREQMKSITRMEEAAGARQVWSHYLKYGKDDELLKLAKECEDRYNLIVPHRFNVLFSWEKTSARESELQKIEQKFGEAESVEDIRNFFDEARTYCKAHNPNSNAEDGHLYCDIAERCHSLFSPDVEPLNPYTKYVIELLKTSDYTDGAIPRFLIYVLRKYICTIKLAMGGAAGVELIKRKFDQSPQKERLFCDVYADMDEEVVGKICKEELDYALSEAFAFSPENCVSVLPIFCGVGKELVIGRIEKVLDSLKENSKRFNDAMYLLIQHLYLSALRNDFKGGQLPMLWLLEYIISNQMDGRLFNLYDLEYLASKAQAKLGFKWFKMFALSRVELEKQERPYDGFEIIPYGFSAAKFFGKDDEVEALEDVCRIVAFTKGYFPRFTLPKCIAEIDPDADIISSCVRKILAANQDANFELLFGIGRLASPFSDDSRPWAKIVEPICDYAIRQGMTKKDMVRLYQSFVPSMRTWSSNVGEIPQEFINRRKSTKRMLDSTSMSSSLRGYRQWAANIAEKEYQEAADEAEAARHE